ncbi:TonB-dependent receptor plug domain-containing protein [Phascolarctobacterium succinatutens]|uniref:TonB-dependent receptor plug domain-containing protein n=6 Tax=Phascolarctobacterium succinatutens TaxID=626940 RepID=UPI003AF05E8A
MQKKELSKLVLTTLLTGSVLWGGTAFAAEENLQEFSLDTMVVTATRTEMSVKEAPSAVQVVDSKKLEQTQAKTLHDALKGALGVNVFNDFQGRSNVSIRGSESRHVLILVDGKRLGGEAAYNSANAWDVDRIRMEDVEKVEIIRGPAGALYGSDAMGGVINVVTKTPNKTIASINYEYGWYENGKGAGYKSNLYLQGAEKNYSYKINAGLNNSRPYDVLNPSDKAPTGSYADYNFYGEEQPLSVNVGYTFDNGNKLGLDFSRLKEKTQQAGAPTRTFMNKPGTSITPTTPYQDKIKTIYNDNKRTDYAITYQGSDDKQDWMFRAYKSVFDKHYKNQDLKRMTMRGRPGAWNMDAPKIDTIKRTLSVIEGKDTFNLSDKNKLTAGFEYRKDESEGTRLKKPNTSLSGSSARDAFDKAAINYMAAYVQDEFRPNDKWLIIPSVRFDHSDQFSNKLTSNLAATYNAADDVRIKAVVGQGYKTPTVNDLYIFWEMYAKNPGSDGQFYVGNPDLKPEKSLSYELSVEKDWGDRSTVHFGLFRNEVKDLIGTYWTGKMTEDYPDIYPGITGDRIMAYENIPEALLQGVELYGSHRIGKDIYLNAGYTFLDAKDKTAGTRLKDRAKHQVTFGVSYQPENIYAWDLSFDLVSNINYYFNNGDKSTMGNFVYETKDFTIANIMTSRHLNKDTKIYLGIDNISNHQNFGAYSDGNLGRMYRVGMEYKF